MKRDPENNIVFTAAESLEFDMPEMVTPEQAVETAMILTVVAQSFTNRAAAQLNSANKDSVRHKQQLDIRAGRLACFSERVFGLCPDEHLDFIIGNSPSVA
jgi:hypothetical protein